MSWPQRIFVGAALFLLFLPDVSIAATPQTQALTIQAQIAVLQAQLAQLQAQLASSTVVVTSQPTAHVVIPVTQHVDETGGRLRITFLSFLTPTQPAASSSIQYPLGKFLLDYSSCATVFCANPYYPTGVTELWVGESTIYRDYKITLDGFNGSTASLTLLKQQ